VFIVKFLMSVSAYTSDDRLLSGSWSRSDMWFRARWTRGNERLPQSMFGTGAPLLLAWLIERSKAVLVCKVRYIVTVINKISRSIVHIPHNKKESNHLIQKAQN
jgi:hypothetical protein